MYKLSYFTEEEDEKVLEFIKKNPFAVITGKGDKYPVATHIPLDINIQPDTANSKVKSQNYTLTFTGHMMKNTDHHKAFEKDSNVLVIFTGPHCFVSANWYPGEVSASTWNYVTVHAKGKIKFTDEKATVEIVKAITDKYEGTVSRVAFNKLPEEYVNRLVKAIVGFTIEVESIENVFKLSQNHPEEIRDNIIEQLEKRGDYNSTEIASAMRTTKSAKIKTPDTP